MIQDDGKIVGGLLGIVPGVVQEIGFAELYALVRALREAEAVEGNLIVIADCRNVLDDCQKGPAWCLSPQCKYAELWHEAWFRIHDLGERFELHWARAHASWAAAEREGAPAHWYIGNKEADERAKEGAQLHGDFAQVEELAAR
eukprot:830210-Pyramimonas_sp.AAC.1